MAYRVCPRSLLRLATGIGLAAMLCGCVAYPAGPYYGGYGYAPYYYGPPVAGTVVLGGKTIPILAPAGPRWVLVILHAQAL